MGIRQATAGVSCPEQRHTFANAALSFSSAHFISRVDKYKMSRFSCLYSVQKYLRFRPSVARCGARSIASARTRAL